MLDTGIKLGPAVEEVELSVDRLRDRRCLTGNPMLKNLDYWRTSYERVIY